MYSTKATKRPKKETPRHAILSIIVIVALLAIGGALVFANHHRHHNTKNNAGSGNTATNPNARLPGQASSSTPSSSGSGAQAKAPDKPPVSSGKPPKAPDNDGLVSNHQPSLTPSGFNSNQENSVCVTSPGADCEITFTLGSTVKSLGKKQADATGAVYWSNWKLQDIGLTVGDWTITATATQNGQSGVTTDPNKLQVRQ